MKKISVFLVVFCFFSAWLMAQPGALTSVTADNIPAYNPPPLSEEELYRLSMVPLLDESEVNLSEYIPLLPYMVDNSTQPYFRPITTQSGYECGQSAGIAFNFTYEIDRLRNVPANVAQNQYVTHFAWDFLNGGNNYTGASAMDGFEVVRVLGTPNVADYGGALNTGGYLRWMSGYQQYLNAMHNRIYEVRRLDCRTPGGLMVLKNWIHNHLEGAAIGGVGNFYGTYCSPNATLPPGTPEAGKALVSSWGSSPSHTWTVCGYNDSIRYDFNGDGQYTNNLDINSDGVVNMKDWEIGGLKFANGYSGTGWGNGGFAYMMYKALADDIGFGGIWNHSIYILKVRQDVSPKLTMKVTLKHSSRNKIKVTAGMNTNLSATSPSIVMEFPAFNFQGGNYYMQGGSTEADKTIELGLDITPLLSNIASSTPVKWFLQVEENDPGNAGTGQITSFSLFDYTSGSQEIPCPSTNVPLVENGMTRVSVNHTVNFSKVNITTTALPPATLYTPYSYQMAATGGTTPYYWDFKIDYPETSATATMPNPTAQQIAFSSNDNGRTAKKLDFDFPFFDKNYDTVYICTDGHILLDDILYTWPYLIDKYLLFKSTPIISPFLADLYMYSSQSDGVWYEGDATYAMFRWKTHIYNQQSTSNLNFTVKLYPSGAIEFYYGTMQYPSVSWTGGLSGGDNRNWNFSDNTNAGSIAANTKITFASPNHPTEMSISESGLLTGTITQVIPNQLINFWVTDNNNISNYKQLPFGIQGISILYTINAGGDQIIEFGETVNVNVSVTNTFSTPITNVVMKLRTQDPYVTLSDSVENIGTMTAGQTLNINNAFTFAVSTSVPNAHPINMHMKLFCNQDTVRKDMFLTAYAPAVDATSLIINDNQNGVLDPGETSDITINFTNEGGCKVTNLLIAISSNDPYITINSGSGSIPLLDPGATQPCLFNISAAGNTPPQYIAALYVSIQGNNNYSTMDTLYIFFGQIVEDWETGDFTKFDWQMGYWPWTIDSTIKYEGNFAARSAWMTDNNESMLYINMNVITDGIISFYKKVSCENDPSGTNYDYLAFFIDNVEMGRWDGEIDWSKETFNVEDGTHTFKWLYHKDYSVSSGMDATWVDYIVFPPIAQALPTMTVTPDAIAKTMDPNQLAYDTVYVTNAGGGVLNFSIFVYDTTALKKHIPAGPGDNISGSGITCSTAAFAPGTPFSWTFTASNGSIDNEYIKHLSIDFPEGVIVNSATNFIGGSGGPLVYDNTTGNGAEVNWHGESAGRGVLKNGESAVATVNGMIDLSIISNLVLEFKMIGDNIGVNPHVLYGVIPLSNIGLPNNWLSLNFNTNNLQAGETSIIELTFNTTGMVPGYYHCDIVINDQMNEQKLIPVNLTIPFPIGFDQPVSGNSLLKVQPNPFRERTWISYELPVATDVLMQIFSITGNPVRNLIDTHLPEGKHEIQWDGCDEAGKLVSPGTYFLRVTSSGSVDQEKLIRIR